MRLLLLSNSTNHGEPYLSHAAEWMASFLADARRVAFVPYAGVTISYDDYAGRVAEALAPLGVELLPVHRGDPLDVLAEADAVAVGGGNTFRLVERLYATGLMQAIRERVRAGMPYAGWSAGSNVACPTLRTTNDMPVIAPESFETLGLVPFQINPHYLDAHPSRHQGETRAQRIAEFCEINPRVPVVGLREGSALLREGDALRLPGPHDARHFLGRGADEWSADADWNALLS
jgi:dipeptidase E